MTSASDSSSCNPQTKVRGGGGDITQILVHCDPIFINFVGRIIF